MGPRAGLEGGKFLSHRDSIPDRPARSSAAIPTELPGPQFFIYTVHRLYAHMHRLHIISV